MTEDQDRLLGADVLEQYISTTYPSVNAFAKTHGFDQSTISKLLRGERGSQMTVELAAAIERATEGVVKMHMWLPE